MALFIIFCQFSLPPACSHSIFIPLWFLLVFILQGNVKWHGKVIFFPFPFCPDNNTVTPLIENTAVFYKFILVRIIAGFWVFFVVNCTVVCCAVFQPRFCTCLDSFPAVAVFFLQDIIIRYDGGSIQWEKCININTFAVYKPYIYFYVTKLVH